MAFDRMRPKRHPYEQGRYSIFFESFLGLFVRWELDRRERVSVLTEPHTPLLPIRHPTRFAPSADPVPPCFV